MAEQETWQSQTDATVFVYKKDRRSGDWKPERVGGPNGKARVRLSSDEREYNQELVPEENAHLDPFTNGRLVRVDQNQDGVVTREDLAGLLTVETEEELGAVMADIEDELTLRRLLEVAATDGKMWQVEVLRNEVDDRYSVAKSQRAVVEMMQAPEGSRDEAVG